MSGATDEAGSRKLIGRASIAAGGTAFQQGISFLSGLIVARVIGASDYGIFNLARNLVDVTGTLTRLGLDIGLQRYFGEAKDARNGDACIVVLRRVRMLAGVLALLPALAIALGLGRVLEAHFYRHSSFAEILFCLALALPFVTDIAVLGGAYRGVLKLTPSVIAECILLPTLRLAAIVVLFAVGWRLWAVAVGTTLASFLASAFLALRARSDFPRSRPTRSQSWDDALKVVRYSTVLALAVLVTTLTASMDVLVLGRFATAQDLGQYSLVKMLLTLMAVFAAAFSQGLGALVAERYFRGDLAGMVRVMSMSIRWITFTALPVFAIFLFWGAQLTLLLGPSFAASQAVVNWLAAAQLVLVVFGPCGWALSMTGKHFLELKILSAGLVIAAILCWLAVPAFGQLGAAVATCTSVAIANFARVLAVRRSIGALPFGGDIVAVAAAGIGLAWASDLVVAQLLLPEPWNTISGIGCFVAAYGIVVWTRLLDPSERSAFQDAAGSAALVLFWRGR